MYEVERLATRTSETIVVRKNGRHVAAASITFIRWLRERVPRKQLRPELVALVDWYESQQPRSEKAHGAVAAPARQLPSRPPHGFNYLRVRARQVMAKHRRSRGGAAGDVAGR